MLVSLQEHLPPINFVTLHYVYFIGTCIISALIFWGASTPSQSISFTDALFLTVSAMTESGLNTVNLSQLNTFQQVMLFFLIMLGSTILVSSVVVKVRKTAFEKRFAKLVEEQRESGRGRSGTGGLSFVRSFTRRRRTVNTREKTQDLPQVDGIVVRGRPIQTADQDSQALSPTYNPGDHPRPEKEREGHSSMSPSGEHNNAHQPLEPHFVEESSTDHGDEISSHLPGRADNSRSPVGSPRAYTIRFADGDMQGRRRYTRVLSMSGVGARQDLSNHPSHAPAFEEPLQPTTSISEKGNHRQSTTKYLLSGGFIGRNSQFHSLSPSEREKLGGVEYRALKLLEVIIPLYWILFQLFGCIGCAAWISVNATDITLQNGINPWWVGAFNAVSAFNNSGMSLLDANMVAFQFSDYMLITMGLLILAGNTCYPIFLRLIIWTLWRLLPNDEYFHDTRIAVRFLLDHPRRCYTTLFPSYHTWFLIGAVIALNGVDWFAFEVLNIGNAYTASLPTNTRVIDGLFQAFAVRSGGFYVVPIANVSIGLQVLYVLMMYISVYPVTMTMRNSNVYEERSLGIYADEDGRLPSGSDAGTSDEAANKNSTDVVDDKKSFVGKLKRHVTNQRLYNETGTHSRSYFIRQQLRSQLAHDLWWICLAVLFITIIEGSSFAADPVAYSVFNIVFEVVSAYGTVGISVGLPNVAYSFSGGWHVLSKLILCLVMLRGRHRGLPVAIDRAVLLPGEHLARAEEEDARLRLERVGTTATTRTRPISRAVSEAVV